MQYFEFWSCVVAGYVAREENGRSTRRPRRGGAVEGFLGLRGRQTGRLYQVSIDPSLKRSLRDSWMKHACGVPVIWFLVYACSRTVIWYQAILRIRTRFLELPGSGFVSSRSGSGSFYHRAKIVRKALIPTFLWLLYDFLVFIFEKLCKCSFKR